MYYNVITCDVDRVVKITWDSTTEGFVARGLRLLPANTDVDQCQQPCRAKDAKGRHQERDGFPEPSRIWVVVCDLNSTPLTRKIGP